MAARRWCIQAVGFLFLATLVGCSKKDAGLATVSGVVTHNGTPVDGAQVVFASTIEVEGKKTPSFGALTDSAGKYVIATNGKEPGIPPGLYKVTVVKIDAKSGNPSAQPLDPGQLDAMAIGAETGGGGAKSGPVNLLPKEYATVGSTKLSATLQEGKNENVNFDLKGK